jgi:4-hydroxy-tetrahydrodipicolinate synthase
MSLGLAIVGYGKMGRLIEQLALQGDFPGARAIHRRIHALMEINFVESNSIPVEAAMAEMGLREPVWRLPLVALKAENQARIRAALESLGLVGRASAAPLVERVHAAIAS